MKKSSVSLWCYRVGEKDGMTTMQPCAAGLRKGWKVFKPFKVQQRMITSVTGWKALALFKRFCRRLISLERRIQSWMYPAENGT